MTISPAVAIPGSYREEAPTSPELGMRERLQDGLDLLLCDPPVLSLKSLRSSRGLSGRGPLAGLKFADEPHHMGREHPSFDLLSRFPDAGSASPQPSLGRRKEEKPSRDGAGTYSSTGDASLGFRGWCACRKLDLLLPHVRTHGSSRRERLSGSPVAEGGPGTGGFMSRDRWGRWPL